MEKASLFGYGQTDTKFLVLNPTIKKRQGTIPGMIRD
jgi:hypothetical protein